MWGSGGGGQGKCSGTSLATASNSGREIERLWYAYVFYSYERGLAQSCQQRCLPRRDHTELAARSPFGRRPAGGRHHAEPAAPQLRGAAGPVHLAALPGHRVHGQGQPHRLPAGGAGGPSSGSRPHLATPPRHGGRSWQCCLHTHRPCMHLLAPRSAIAGFGGISAMASPPCYPLPAYASPPPPPRQWTLPAAWSTCIPARRPLSTVTSRAQT